MTSSAIIPFGRYTFKHVSKHEHIIFRSFYTNTQIILYNLTIFEKFDGVYGMLCVMVYGGRKKEERSIAITL